MEGPLRPLGQIDAPIDVELQRCFLKHSGELLTELLHVVAKLHDRDDTFKLTTAKRVAVVAALCEGNSIRSTVRMTGVAKNTIVKLLLDLAPAVTRYQDERLRNLPCKLLQCDEIWAFVGGKDKNLSNEKKKRASVLCGRGRALMPTLS